MKNILFAIALFLSLKSFAQSPNDSAYTKNLPLQARIIAYLTPQAFNPDNDSLFNVFIKWRASLRANPVSGTTTVTIDTIPTVELANLYNYTLSNSDGMGVSNIMKSQIASARTLNPYLDRMCTSFEQLWAQKLAALILNGRRLLLGK